MTSELKYTLSGALIVLLLAAAYGLRITVKGRAHFARIDRQGGSRLLSKGAMELGYWILHPVLDSSLALELLRIRYPGHLSASVFLRGRAWLRGTLGLARYSPRFPVCSILWMEWSRGFQVSRLTLAKF